MRSRIVLALICALALALPGTRANAADEAQKKPKVIEEKGQKARGSDQDENVKSKSVDNDPNSKAAAPPNKGGPKARGGRGYCSIYVDNWTQWKVQIFVDGDYKGLLSPWGGGWVNAGEGTTRAYARADFTGGDVLRRGPHVFNCEEYSNYTWKIE